jgi:hypothetical protein
MRPSHSHPEDLQMLKFRIAPALFVVIGLAVFLPSSSAAAATCTGKPHDAGTDSNPTNQIDVSCDGAIANGKVTVRVNRATDKAIPKVANGNGSFGSSCTVNEEPQGTGFDQSIVCSGSMDAGATLQITAQFGPNPCSSPAFKGELTVEFGDGTTFGPGPIDAYPCGGNTGGGGTAQPGKDFDPGGVFQGVKKKPPSKASVDAAKAGLKFTLTLGVKGKVTVTIEVKGKSVGKTTKLTSGGDTKLAAKLAKSKAGALEDKTTKAKIHVHVVPDKSEGFTTPGEKYFKLKLTG